MKHGTSNAETTVAEPCAPASSSFHLAPNWEQPDLIMCIQVGPLPLGEGASITPMRADGEIPWIKRPNSDQGERTATA